MTSKIVKLNSLGTIKNRDNIISLIKNYDKIELLTLDNEMNAIEIITSFTGKKGFLLSSENDIHVCSIDNKLILIDNKKIYTVLQCNHPENFFWHLTKAEDTYFVHEYGSSPCNLYKSIDLEKWNKVISNHELDKKSRHFHNIYYDQYRKWLIATLGDNCLNRIVYSTDLGASWKIMYKGPWQFVPIVALESKLIFGMDSGIVKGGCGIYSFDYNQWEFTFLRWKNKEIKLSQFCDLKYTTEGYWLAALGMPQAFIISKDLVNWYPLYIESYCNEYLHNMSINVGDKQIICSTGNNIISFPKDTLHSLFKNEKIIEKYSSIIDTLRGFAFSIKHNIL